MACLTIFTRKSTGISHPWASATPGHQPPRASATPGISHPGQGKQKIRGNNYRYQLCCSFNFPLFYNFFFSVLAFVLSLLSCLLSSPFQQPTTITTTAASSNNNNNNTHKGNNTTRLQQQQQQQQPQTTTTTTTHTKE